MFQPIKSVFDRPPRTWDTSDVKHFIQEYLRHQLHSDSVYCDSVRGETAQVRAATPAERQEVLLLQYDLVKELAQHTDYHLTSLELTT